GERRSNAAAAAGSAASAAASSGGTAISRGPSSGSSSTLTRSPKAAPAASLVALWTPRQVAPPPVGIVLLRNSTPFSRPRTRRRSPRSSVRTTSAGRRTNAPPPGPGSSRPSKRAIVTDALCHRAPPTSSRTLTTDAARLGAARAAVYGEDRDARDRGPAAARQPGGLPLRRRCPLDDD